MVVCTQGAEEASVAAQWATQSRAGGATVGVCPPDLLDSHAKFNSGTYDSIVVEAGGGLGDAVLAEVTMPRLVKGQGVGRGAWGFLLLCGACQHGLYVQQSLVRRVYLYAIFFLSCAGSARGTEMVRVPAVCVDGGTGCCLRVDERISTLQTWPTQGRMRASTHILYVLALKGRQVCATPAKIYD